jgi:hypothetical protein
MREAECATPTGFVGVAKWLIHKGKVDGPRLVERDR